MSKKKSIYICYFLEEKSVEPLNIVIGAAKTLQRGKSVCEEYWNELNEIYPMPTDKPFEWEADYKDDITVYLDSTKRFFIEKWELK